MTTDNDKRAAIAALRKAREALTRVCREQGFKLTATVPARPDRDDDLVISYGIEKALRALEADDGRALLRKPDGYAYRYHSPCGGTTLRFNNGEEVNGGRPFESVPYYLGTAPEQPAAEPVPDKTRPEDDPLRTASATRYVGGPEMTDRVRDDAIRELCRRALEVRP